MFLILLQGSVMSPGFCSFPFRILCAWFFLVKLSFMVTLSGSLPQTQQQPLGKVAKPGLKPGLVYCPRTTSLCIDSSGALLEKKFHLETRFKGCKSLQLHQHHLYQLGSLILFPNFWISEALLPISLSLI